MSAQRIASVVGNGCACERWGWSPEHITRGPRRGADGKPHHPSCPKANADAAFAALEVEAAMRRLFTVSWSGETEGRRWFVVEHAGQRVRIEVTPEGGA